MTLLRIKVAGNPALKKKALPVINIDESVRVLAADMAETMRAANGLGLAAPQVGISLRIVIIDFGYCEFDRLSEEEKKTAKIEFRSVVLINPEILSHQGAVKKEEGCLSVPGYRAVVDRYENVRFRYTDIEGNTIEEDATGLKAIALQHELDHLNGVLFIDRISRLKKNIAIKKVKKYIEDLEDEENETEIYLYGQP